MAEGYPNATENAIFASMAVAGVLFSCVISQTRTPLPCSTCPSRRSISRIASLARKNQNTIHGKPSRYHLQMTRMITAIQITRPMPAIFPARSRPIRIGRVTRPAALSLSRSQLLFESINCDTISIIGTDLNSTTGCRLPVSARYTPQGTRPPRVRPERISPTGSLELAFEKPEYVSAIIAPVTPMTRTSVPQRKTT